MRSQGDHMNNLSIAGECRRHDLFLLAGAATNDLQRGTATSAFVPHHPAHWTRLHAAGTHGQH